MPHRIKIVSVLLIGTSLCVFALAAGLLWYANSGHARAKLLREVNARVSGRLAVGHHHISLFEGRLLLRKLRLSGPDGKDLAGLEELSIDLSMAAIFRKSLVVEALECVQPWVRLSVDSGGRLNIAKALASGDSKAPEAPSSSGGLPFNVIVNRFRLSDGYVEYAHAAGRQYLTLKGIEAGASFNLQDKSGVFQVSADKSRAGYDDYLSDFKHLNLALAVNNGHIEPLVLKAESRFASLLLYGDVHQAFSDPKLDLTLDMDVVLSEAEAVFDIDRGDTGRVKASMNVKGKPENPQVNLRADYGGGSIAGRSVSHVGLETKLRDRVVTLENLSASTDFGLLGLSGQADFRQVFPKGFLSPPGDWEDAAFKGTLRTESFDLSAIPVKGNSISGRMDALLNITGKSLSIESLMAEVGAVMALEDFKLGGMQQPIGIRSRVDGRVQAGTLWLDNMEAETKEVYISAGGSLDIKNEIIDARFNMETHEVASLLSIFGLSQVEGAVAVKGRLQGSSTNPMINLSSTGRSVRIRGIDIGNVQLETGLNPSGRLDVHTITIENRGSYLKADGEMQLFADPFELHPDMPLNARLILSNVEYRDFFIDTHHDPDIRGSLGGEVVLSGNLRSLKVRADVSVKGVEVEQVRLGDVSGKARFLDGKLLLDSLRLTNHRTDLNARGEIRLFRKGSWQTVNNPVFKLDLADGYISLEDFSKEISGELRIDTDLAGQLKAPRGRLSIKGNDLDLGVQKIKGLNLDMQAEGRQVNIEPFDIVFPGGGIVKGQGRVGYDQSFQFSLLTHDLPIDSIDRVREIKNVNGRLDVEILGKGTLQRPEVKGKTLFKNIQIRNETIDDAAVHFDFKDGRVTLSGRHAFDLDAEYDLANKAYSLSLMLNNTSLTPWFVIAGRPELSGNVSGQIEAEGIAGTLDRTRATINIHNVGVDFKGQPFAAINQLRGTLNQQIFNIPGFQVGLLDQGQFSVKGSGDIFGSVNLDIDGDIPLKAANLFVRDLPEIKGILSLKTSLGGTLKEPELNGEILVEQGGVTIPELQQELHSINGRVALSSAGEIDGYLNGMLDSGRFEVKTAIKMDGFLPRQIEARINADSLPMQIPNTLEMLLNMDLSVRGTPDKLDVEGEVVLLEGIYYKDFKLNLLQAIQQEKREERPLRVESPYPYLKPLRFNIHFKHRQPFLVDNNIAHMDISPDVILRGTPENPIITGSAKVDNGVVTYLKNEFVVDQGAVDFVNPYETEAEIDIQGEVEVREWRITISLYGPPDRLTLDLSSSPPEEDADIISLLVFKKTTYELNTGSSGAGLSPTVLLAQLLASSFGEDIKESTGIDVLEVEAESAEDRDSTDRIKVTVGKDLSERMTVKYSVESKDGGYVQRASTEYKLFEHFMVSGFQDTKGVYGGELIFRLEFRLFQ